MWIKKVDARGLACPKPVMLTKQAIDDMQQGIVTVMVDNQVARENVTKFATAKGCSVNVENIDDYFSVTIHRGEAPLLGVEEDSTANTSNTTYVITQDTLGHGSKALGKILIKSFLYTLLETKPLPRYIILMNAGVLLAIEGSEVLGHLQGLVDQGVEILSCGTCLDYYKVKTNLAVGEITNMYTIVETMNIAQKVITL